MSLTQEECVSHYKPGSIRRVKLKNFLTYEEVEFCPGPRLNMVIGPNGTGKSTILCAICLGLGGEPKLLGRADDARTFINHEKTSAMIEIELAPQAPVNGRAAEVHVFKRIIDRNKGSERGNGRGASTYYINDSQCPAMEVRRVVSEVYHIAVDNLCTFLPQDLVGSFSAFDAQQLLIETEKSMSGNQHLYETHQELIEAEESLRKDGNEKKSIQAKLESLEAENARLEREKERMEEREAALAKMELFKKKILWLRFEKTRDRCIELKNKKADAKKDLDEAQRELEPLQEHHDTLKMEEERVKAKFHALDKVVKKADREMTKHKEKAETHLDKIDEITADLTAIDSQQRNHERAIEQHQEKVDEVEADLADFPPKESLDDALAEVQKELRSNQPQLIHARREVSHFQEQYKEKEEHHKEAQRKLIKSNDERARRRDRVFRQEPKLKQAFDWVDQNRQKFRRPVWGPILCEVSPKSKSAAAFLEQHVPNTTLKSFVVECRDDANLLYREIRERRKIPVNVVEVPQGKLGTLERWYSESKIRTLKKEHGIQGFMDESFSAPDAIIEALRGAASIENVLIGTEKTQESIDRHGLLDYLSEREDGGQGLRKSCVFTNQKDRSYKYTTTISRYSGKPATRVDDINPAKWLAPGVDPAEKAMLEKKVADLEKELQEMKSEHTDVQARFEQAQGVLQQIQARVKKAKENRGKLTKLQQKLASAKRKLKDAQKEATRDNTDEKKECVRNLMARVKGNVVALEAHASSHEEMMKSTFVLAGVKIDKERIASSFREAANVLGEKEFQCNGIEQKFQEISMDFRRCKDELKSIKEHAETEAPIRDANGSLPLMEELEKLDVRTLEEAEAAYEEASTKANSIDANPDVIRQYEERKIEIEDIRKKLADVDEHNNSRLEALQTKRQPWESALENSVGKVNVLFSKYMRELGCAGEVSLYKGEEEARRGHAARDQAEEPKHFKNWGIEIKVKFREKSSLQVLSAQVQSGGERSVSTIMYLMALQELMVSPFRCVDEINQGLDERNERLVFKRIVTNSTAQPKPGTDDNCHSGQYFLITPKLLPNMHDMENENMTILGIFNGPYNFKHPRDWNVKKFIETRKRVAAAVEDDEEEDDEADENDSSAINNDTIPRKGSSSAKKRRVQEEDMEEEEEEE